MQKSHSHWDVECSALLLLQQQTALEQLCAGHAMRQSPVSEMSIRKLPRSVQVG